MEALFKQLLQIIGEDPDREGLQMTPRRCSDTYRELTAGYHQNLDEIVNGALFQAESDGMVIVKDIEMYSLCEHHMLPIIGKVHVGYIPNEHILGLSKVARIVDMFARRLQVQERLGQQVCEALNTVLKPKGVGVVIEADHLCMMMRGVSKQHSNAVTSHVTGLFKEDSKTREEFMDLIR